MSKLWNSRQRRKSDTIAHEIIVKTMGELNIKWEAHAKKKAPSATSLATTSGGALKNLTRLEKILTHTDPISQGERIWLVDSYNYMPRRSHISRVRKEPQQRRNAGSVVMPGRSIHSSGTMHSTETDTENITVFHRTEESRDSWAGSMAIEQKSSQHRYTTRSQMVSLNLKRLEWSQSSETK